MNPAYDFADSVASASASSGIGLATHAFVESGAAAVLADQR